MGIIFTLFTIPFMVIYHHGTNSEYHEKVCPYFIIVPQPREQYFCQIHALICESQQSHVRHIAVSCASHREMDSNTYSALHSSENSVTSQSGITWRNSGMLFVMEMFIAPLRYRNFVGVVISSAIFCLRSVVRVFSKYVM